MMTNEISDHRLPSPFGWSPIFAGSLLAAAVFFVLMTFGSALGLGTASTSPTWRDASFALWFLSGIYLLLSAVVSFSIGGYVAGRLRSKVPFVTADAEFFAGLRGLLTWALAIVLMSILFFVAVQSVRPAATNGYGSAAATSSNGEGVMSAELDRLFRGDGRTPDVDMTYPRAEASRILLASSGHVGIQADDRLYLVTLVRANTGLAPPEAERRVNAVIARAQDSISRARKVTVLLGFMTAVSLLLGAVVAWFTSERGERDGRGLDRSAVAALFNDRTPSSTGGAAVSPSVGTGAGLHQPE